MKRFLALALIVFGTSAAIFAQTAAPAPVAAKSTGALTEMKVFALESSIVTGYSLEQKKPLGGYSFILNFPVADNFALGIQTLSFTSNSVAYNFVSMKASYYLSDLLGFTASFGNDGTDPLIGFGAFSTPFKNASTTGFSNATRVRLDYYFPVSTTKDISKGALNLSVGFALGL